MAVPMSESYSRQLAAEEASPVPLFIRFVRVAVWLLYAVVLVKVVILMIAFVLQLLNASTSAEFTAWVYRSADSSMGPFRGIFPATEVGEGSVLNASLLFAAAMYVFAAILLDLVMRALTARLVGRQRRIAELRSAANDAAVREYAQAQSRALYESTVSGLGADPTPAASTQPKARPVAPGPSGISTPPPPPPPGTRR
jgi:uncharacterized protein YggT (Ycf19 family)